MYSVSFIIALLLVCSSLLQSSNATLLDRMKLVLSRGAAHSERVVLKAKSMSRSLLQTRGGASKTVIEVENVQQLDKVLADGKGKLVVLDFTAAWCGPCRMIAPIYQQLSEEFTKAIFTKVITNYGILCVHDAVYKFIHHSQVDVDKAQDIAAKYEIKSMPTFLFIKNGKVMARFSGASVEKLTETIKLYQ